MLAQDPQGGIQLAQGLLVVSEAAEELRQNIAEEQQLHNQFLVAVRATLTPLQSATAIVQVCLAPSQEQNPACLSACLLSALVFY